MRMWLSQVCMCLCVRLVRSSAEVMQLINSVLKLRSHSPTLVHMDSSRSHFIVTLTVTSRSPDALALGMIYRKVFIQVPNSGFEAVPSSHTPLSAAHTVMAVKWDRACYLKTHKQTLILTTLFSHTPTALVIYTYTHSSTFSVLWKKSSGLTPKVSHSSTERPHKVCHKVDLRVYHQTHMGRRHNYIKINGKNYNPQNDGCT